MEDLKVTSIGVKEFRNLLKRKDIPSALQKILFLRRTFYDKKIWTLDFRSSTKSGVMKHARIY